MYGGGIVSRYRNYAPIQWIMDFTPPFNCNNGFAAGFFWSIGK